MDAISHFDLTPDAVHWWQADLSRLPADPCDWLNADEVARAERTANPLVRQRFIQVRAALRWLLGEYLGVHPAAVPIVVGPHGKPGLAGTASGPDMAFNLSHCGDRALFAFARNRYLGVDLEAARPNRNLTELAGRVLAPAERDSWIKLDEALRVSRFYQWWACKEAFSKAVGLGLQVGFQDVIIDPSRPALLAVPPNYGDPSEWQLRYLAAGHEAVACVCYRGGPAKMSGTDLLSWHQCGRKFPQIRQIR